MTADDMPELAALIVEALRGDPSESPPRPPPSGRASRRCTTSNRDLCVKYSPAFVSDLESNRRTAIDFFDLVFNQQRIDLAFERCIGTTYTQHNPAVADGREGLAEFVGNMLAEFPEFTTTVLRTVAEGDFVALHVLARRTPDDPGVVSMDIFRFEDGKIVEHWDVIQDIPDTSANSNGML